MSFPVPYARVLILLVVRLLAEVAPSRDDRWALGEDPTHKYALRFKSVFLAGLDSILKEYGHRTLENSIVSNVPYNLSVVCQHCGTAQTFVTSYEINVTRSNGAHVRRYLRPLNGETLLLPAQVVWRAPYLEHLACLNFRLFVDEGNLTYLSNTLLCSYPGCLSYHKLESGVVTSPVHHQNQTELNCTYVIVNERKSQIQLQFRDFSLQRAESKCMDYIRVYESTTDGRPRCGTALRPSLSRLHFTSQNYRLVIVLVVNNSSQYTNGFNATYYRLLDTDCGQKLTSSYGTISSPNYPQPYFPNTRCTYIIVQPYGHRVRISVNFLELEQGDTSGCQWDYIVARSGKAELRRWCGSSDDYTLHKLSVTSQAARNNNSYVEIVFQSDAIGEGRGFMLSYLVINPVCPSPLDITANGGTIVSPAYPASYPSNTTCLNSLRSIKDSYIEIKFAMLSTSTPLGFPLSGSDCGTDYVDIYDGLDSHRRCGDWQNDTDKLLFRSHGNNLTVIFVSNDDEETSNGFFATWETVNSSMPKKPCAREWIDGGSFCLKIISQYQQSWHNAKKMCVKNGGYLATIDSLDTNNLIQKHLAKRMLDPNEGFWIGANDLVVENDFYWLDHTPVHYTDWFPGWMQFNGSRRQPSDDGLSDEDCVELRITYNYQHKGVGRADKYYWNDRQCEVKNGFICQIDTMKAKVQLETRFCDQDINLSRAGVTESFTSSGYPNKYGNLLDCHTDIVSPIGSQIHIEFTHFHLEEETKIEDWWNMYRGRESGVLRINETATSLVGSDSSPGYPHQNYSSGIMKTLHLILPTSYRIVFNVSFLDIEPHEKCIHDSLTIADSDVILRHSLTACGWAREQKNNYFVSLTNDVTITFISDDSVTGRGYELSWIGHDMKACNQTILLAKGKRAPITSFNHNISYFSRLECRTNLIAEKGYRVLIEFLQFDLAITPHAPCGDYLSVAISNHSDPLQLCPETGFENHGNRFLSEDNTLSLHFHSDDAEEAGGYKAVCTQVLQDIMHVVRAKSFITNAIHSVNFNIGFLANVSQAIVIMAPLGKNVIVTIRRLIPVLPYGECDSTKLDIRDFLNSPTSSPMMHIDMCNTSLLDYSRPMTSYLHAMIIQMNTKNILIEHAFGYLIEYTIIEDRDYIIKSELISASFDGCQPDPCQHDALCVVNNDGFSTCECTSHYTGMLCQSTWCHQKPCHNGTCHLTPTSFSCGCDDGFWGNTCNMTETQCDEMICSNNGFCQKTSNNNTRCRCKDEFTGTSCLEKVKVSRRQSIGKRLLDEPIWIGLIAVVTVLCLYCFFYLARRRCERHFQCCAPISDSTRKSGDKNDVLSIISTSSRNDNNAFTASDYLPEIVIDEVDNNGPLSPSVNATNSYAAARIFDAFKPREIGKPSRNSVFDPTGENIRKSKRNNPTFVLCSEDINSSGDDHRRRAENVSSLVKRSCSFTKTNNFPRDLHITHTNSLDERACGRNRPETLHERCGEASIATNTIYPRTMVMDPNNIITQNSRRVPRHPQCIVEERLEDVRPLENSNFVSSQRIKETNETIEGSIRLTTTDPHSSSPTKAQDRRQVYALKAGSFNTLYSGEDHARSNSDPMTERDTTPNSDDLSANRSSSGYLSVGLPVAESDSRSMSLKKLKYLVDQYSASIDKRDSRGHVRARSTRQNRESFNESMAQNKDQFHNKTRRRKKFRRHKTIDFQLSSSNSDEQKTLRQLRRYGVCSLWNGLDNGQSNGRYVIQAHVHKEQGAADSDKEQCYPDARRTSPRSEEGNVSGSISPELEDQGIQIHQSSGNKIDTDSAFSSTNSKSIQTSPVKFFELSEINNSFASSRELSRFNQPPTNTPIISEVSPTTFVRAAVDSAYQTKEPSTDIATIVESPATSHPSVLPTTLLYRRRNKRISNTDSLLHRVSTKLRQIEQQNASFDSIRTVSETKSTSSDESIGQRFGWTNHNKWMQALNEIPDIESVMEEDGYHEDECGTSGRGLTPSSDDSDTYHKRHYVSIELQNFTGVDLSYGVSAEQQEFVV